MQGEGKIIIQECALKPLDNLEASRLEIRTGQYQKAFTSIADKKKKMDSTIGSDAVKYISCEKRLGGGGKAILS